MTLCQSLNINDCFHIQTGAEIEDQSCNGLYACYLSPRIVVEEGSCITTPGYFFVFGKTCAYAPGAHIGKESCLEDFGEVMLKISIVTLINSLCVYISILSRFINHHSKLAKIRMVSVQLKAVVDVMGYAFVHDLILSPFTLTALSGSKIGKGSCRGFTSCNGAGNIGDGSCNNNHACTSFSGTVGNDSCNCNRACAFGQGTVHDGSCGRAYPDINTCNGDYACYDMFGK
jgi:hypothetical protein